MKKIIVAATAAMAWSGAALAQGEPIRIATITSLTGPVAPFARQSVEGMKMGIEYATQGTMTVLGRKIELIQLDDQSKPEVGKALLEEAYNDKKADLAIGGLLSNVALAMLPVAQDAKKVLIVEPAGADSITGSAWNRYIFRTGRNSAMESSASALAIGKPGVQVATLAQDYAFGREGVAAFRTALAKTGATLVAEEYTAMQTTDFTAPAQRLFDALKDKPGDKVIWVLWAGALNAVGKVAELGPERYGIKLSSISQNMPVLQSWKPLAGLEGAAFYYYGHPKNPVNDWLVAEHQKRFNSPPDFFAAGGMIAGIAAVEGIKKAGGTDTEKLIAAMEGMSWDSPKGKITFRKEDHQALQSMWHFRVKNDPAVAWAVPEAVREITAQEMNIPVGTK